MSIEIVTNQNYRLAMCVATFQKFGHCQCPIHFRFGFPSERFTPTCQRFGKHENVGNASSLVLLVDTAGVLDCFIDRRANVLD